MCLRQGKGLFQSESPWGAEARWARLWHEKIQAVVKAERVREDPALLQPLRAWAWNLQHEGECMDRADKGRRWKNISWEYLLSRYAEKYACFQLRHCCFSRRGDIFQSALLSLCQMWSLVPSSCNDICRKNFSQNSTQSRWRCSASNVLPPPILSKDASYPHTAGCSHARSALPTQKPQPRFLGQNPDPALCPWCISWKANSTVIYVSIFCLYQNQRWKTRQS